MGSKAGGSNAAAAIGANTLLALPLVENLSKDVQSWLVHDLWGQERRGDQGRQGTLTSCSHPWPMASSNPLPKLAGAPGSTSAVVSRGGTSRHYQRRLDCSPSTLKLTKILHAIRVRVIQEEVATLDSPVYLKAESQTRILDQVRVYLLSDGLGPGENIHGHESHSPLD